MKKTKSKETDTKQLRKSDYEVKTVKHVVARVFNGTPMALVRQLLDSGQLNESDLKELKTLIDKAGGRK